MVTGVCSLSSHHKQPLQAFQQLLTNRPSFQLGVENQMFSHVQRTQLVLQDLKDKKCSSCVTYGCYTKHSSTAGSPFYCTKIGLPPYFPQVTFLLTVPQSTHHLTSPQWTYLVTMPQSTYPLAPPPPIYCPTTPKSTYSLTASRPIFPVIVSLSSPPKA